MKSFLVIFSRKNKGKLTQEMLEGHIAFLKKLKHLGYLIVCGPFIDNERGMIVLKCADKELATQLINEDPFVKKKYYAHYEITEFMEAKEENSWLASEPQSKNNLS